MCRPFHKERMSSMHSSAATRQIKAIFCPSDCMARAGENYKKLIVIVRGPPGKLKRDSWGLPTQPSAAQPSPAQPSPSRYLPTPSAKHIQALARPSGAAKAKARGKCLRTWHAKSCQVDGS